MVVKPGWEKKKRDSMLRPGTTEVAYLHLVEGRSPWAVVADHSGVTIRGESPKFTAHAELEAFAWVIADALREFLKLRKTRIVVQE